MSAFPSMFEARYIDKPDTSMINPTTRSNTAAVVVFGGGLRDMVDKRYRGRGTKSGEASIPIAEFASALAKEVDLFYKYHL